MLDENTVQALNRQLFSDPKLNTYAILDGAAIPMLLDKLWEEEPEHCCLHSGQLEPDLAETAPYLVRLEQDSAFTNWVLGEGWGEHWGVFAKSEADLQTMRKHLRKYLVVKDPGGKSLYFRYFDPRVLRIYLPTCNAEELEFIFGPISSFEMEAEDPNTIMAFRAKDSELEVAETQLK
jgi:hypothetical protein